MFKKIFGRLLGETHVATPPRPTHPPAPAAESPAAPCAPSAQQADLGVRDGFFDVAQTLCDAFALPAWPRGKSVLPHLLPS